MCSVLGTPSSSDWAQGQQLASQMNFKFPVFTPTHLSQVLGSRVGARGISLIYSTLTWNPAWRSSAQETLKHSYFRVNSQPSSANSAHFSLALRPSRSRRGGAKSDGERVAVPVVPVEPVYEREGLRNYKEEPVTQKDSDDLKLLLESLKSSDVMPVQHKGGRIQNYPSLNNINHRNSRLSYHNNSDEGSDSPGRRFSYAKLNQRFNQNPSVYVPSFSLPKPGKTDSRQD